MVKVAVLQLRTPARLDAARAQLEPLLARAAKAGAKLIVTPEGTNILQRDLARFDEAALFEDEAEALDWYGEQAKTFGVHLLIGSALLKRRSGTAANRSHFF